MKKQLLLLFTLIFPLHAQDDCEPNDTLTTSTEILSSDLSWFGPAKNFHTDTDLDFFSVTGLADQTLTVSIRYSHTAIFNSGHASFQILDQNGNLLSEPTGFLLNNRTNFRTASIPTVAGQTYHIRYSRTGTGNVNYTAGAWFQIPPDSSEENDTFDSAFNLGIAELEAPLIHEGSIHQLNNSDFYRFTPEFSGLVKLTLLADPEQGDLQLALLDEDQNIIQSSSTNTFGELIELALNGEETHYIQVFPSSDQLNHSYKIQIDLEILPDSSEPNDTAETASDLGQLLLNDSILLNQLNSHSSSDDDWFLFEKTEKGVPLIQLSLPSSLSQTSPAITVDIRNADNNHLGQIQISPGELNASFSSQVMSPPGRYFIHIQSSELLPHYNLFIRSAESGSYKEFTFLAKQPDMPFSSRLGLIYAAGGVGNVNALKGIRPNLFNIGHPNLLSGIDLFGVPTRLPITIEYSTDGRHWDPLPTRFMGEGSTNPIPAGFSSDYASFNTGPGILELKKALFRFSTTLDEGPIQ